VKSSTGYAAFLRLTRTQLSTIPPANNEPCRLAHLTFKQIAAIEPPAAFTNLWLEDQRHALVAPSPMVG
jgi:hypothetical protein